MKNNLEWNWSKSKSWKNHYRIIRIKTSITQNQSL